MCVFRDVRWERCYCLSYEALRKKSCVSSPPQGALQEMAVAALAHMLADPPAEFAENEKAHNGFVRLLWYMEKYEANAGKWPISVVVHPSVVPFLEWLRDLLSTHFPDSVIFARNYEYVPPPRYVVPPEKLVSPHI